MRLWPLTTKPQQVCSIPEASHRPGGVWVPAPEGRVCGQVLEEHLGLKTTELAISFSSFFKFLFYFIFELAIFNTVYC